MHFSTLFEINARKSHTSGRNEKLKSLPGYKAVTTFCSGYLYDLRCLFVV